MNVVFDARYRRESGVGRYVVELARELEQHGRLRYTFLRGRHEGSLGMRVPTHPFTVIDQLGVALAVRRLHPQLFHCPHFLVPLLWRGPLVVSIHDVIPLEYPESIGSPVARRLYPFLIEVACARALRLLVPSRATGNALERHGLAPHDRIVVTPYAAPMLAENHADRPIERSAFILYVGDLKPHKNVRTILHAYSGLTPGLRNRARLLIVGDGPDRDSLREQTIALGINEQVSFRGHVSDQELAALYAGAHFVVLPSLAEGFGFPALEAMARGVPAVVSEIPALREITAGAALSFDPHSPEALQVLLARLLEDDDLRADFSARGRQRAVAFSWAVTARLTEDAYEMALSGGEMRKEDDDEGGSRAL